MTREKMKQMVADALEGNINTHNITKVGIQELAEAVMKLWDQGWTWEVPTDSRKTEQVSREWNPDLDWGLE